MVYDLHIDIDLGTGNDSVAKEEFFLILLFTARLAHLI